MNYLEAIKQCKAGNYIRCRFMSKGEYIEWDKKEIRFYYWDATHSGHWSYPQDLDDRDYHKWIEADWVLCNDIKSIPRSARK